MKIWKIILFAWNRICKSGLVQFALRGGSQINMIYRFLKHGVKYSELKTNPDTAIEVWHVVSLVIWFVVFWATFLLDQTAEMFQEFYRSVAFPYWNILWLCIFSLTVYVANRYMDQKYRKRQSDIINVNIVSNVFLIIPVFVFLVCLLVNYSYEGDVVKVSNYLLGGTIIVVYAFVAGYLLFARFKIDRMEKKFVNMLLFVCIVVNLVGINYFSNIAVESKHEGSVQVLNILFLALSSIRLILLFIGHHVNVVKGWMEGIVGFMFGTRWEADSIPRLAMNGREVFSVIVLGLFFFLFYYSHPNHYRFYTLDESSERAFLKDHFLAWMDSTSTVNGDSTSNIYLVAAQGGGSRGGYWTAKSLFYLAKEYPKFDQNLFAISSVSGGTVGAAVYLSTRDNYERGDTGYSSEINKFFGVDYVSTSFFDLLYTDQIGKIFNSHRDRNTQLQNDMEMSFDSVFVKGNPSVKSYNRPFPLIKENGQIETALFANSFNITEKRKAIVSSLEMEDVERFGHDDILKNTKKNLSLPQAVNLSEMFPVLSGSAKIRYCANERMRRFYDGGVYENYGISTIADIYETIIDLRNDGNYRHRKIVVILLLNSKNTESIDYKENYRWDGSIKSMLGALSNSTFVSWPERERQRLNYLLNENFDTLYTIEVDRSYTLNRWISDTTMTEMDDRISSRVDTMNIEPGRKVVNRIGDTLEVYFNSNSTKMSHFARKQLRNYFDEVIDPSKRSGKKISISGFADLSVSPNYYEDLLKKRIFVIWSYLVSLDGKIDRRIEEKYMQMGHLSSEEEKQASNRIVRIELTDD